MWVCVYSWMLSYHPTYNASSHFSFLQVEEEAGAVRYVIPVQSLPMFIGVSLTPSPVAIFKKLPAFTEAI